MLRRIVLSLFLTTQIYPLEIIQRPSKNFNERIDKKSGQPVKKPTHIIIHYTTDCFHSKSYLALSNFLRPVSAHYLIAADGTIYQLVDETKRAWHAGKSFWKNNNQLNTYSIGIEIVNPGYTKRKKNPCWINENIWHKETGIQVPGSPYFWYEFTLEQIKSVTKLCQDIIQRYDIQPEFVLGHSDIAPGRKIDPGPLFPWQQLATDSVGVWPNQISTHTSPTIKEIQGLLKDWGYKIKLTGKLDHQTKKVLKAFQMHFRPENIDGIPDEKTINILRSLTA